MCPSRPPKDRSAGAISRFSIDQLAIPMHMPFTISKETRPMAEVAIIEAYDGGGRIGLGEAAPFPSLTGDTIDEAVVACRGLADELAGRPVDAALARLHELRPQVFPSTPTAFVAMEMALWDLRARQAGKP